MIKSRHRKGGKITTRFGTKGQIDSIVKTYKKETRFKLWKKGLLEHLVRFTI